MEEEVGGNEYFHPEKKVRKIDKESVLPKAKKGGY